MDFQIKKTLKKTIIYDEYWKFAYERQNIFFKKIRDSVGLLTEDPILKLYKFTNVYRASDRVSQYLIKHIIYNDDNDNKNKNIVFKILLFKLFNKIETWTAFENILSKVNIESFCLESYKKILYQLYAEKKSIYSNAYIMTSGRSIFGYERKFMNHLMLIKTMLDDNISNKIEQCNSLKELYNLLLSYPMFGPFLAYQFAIDINYSPIVNFDENEFIVAGPGARSGIYKCFFNAADFTNDYLIRYMVENQEKEFTRLGLDFIYLGNRTLKLIDCQNIFCEIDKYSRVKYPWITTFNKRTRIKQKYIPNSKGIEYFYPPKWGINDFIQ